MSAVSTASTHPGQSGLQPTQGGLQSQASLGSQMGGQSSPMDLGPMPPTDASKRGGNANNMPNLQAGRLGLGLGLKPTAATGKCTLRLCST